MCTYYYLHYHHVLPCTREANYTTHYTFCADATTVTMTVAEAYSLDLIRPGSGDGSMEAAGGGGDSVVVRQPCAALIYYAPRFSRIDSESDPNPNPCGTAGCLISQPCRTGACRLQELGGRWLCCLCGRGNNTFNWCAHPMRRVPDSLCYHVVCQTCQTDVDVDM